MQRSSVVLLQPDGPTTHAISLRLTSSDNWWNDHGAVEDNLLAFSAMIAG